MKKTDLQMRGQKIGMAFAMVLAVLLLLFPVTVHAEGELQVTVMLMYERGRVPTMTRSVR